MRRCARVLEAHADRIEVFYRPPWSLERNPSEYFNGDLKGEIQRSVPPKGSGLEAHDAELISLHTDVSALVRVEFKHCNIRYAA